jgi:hypothetical protein
MISAHVRVRRIKVNDIMSENSRVNWWIHSQIVAVQTARKNFNKKLNKVDLRAELSMRAAAIKLRYKRAKRSIQI